MTRLLILIVTAVALSGCAGDMQLTENCLHKALLCTDLFGNAHNVRIAIGPTHKPGISHAQAQVQTPFGEWKWLTWDGKCFIVQEREPQFREVYYYLYKRSE